MLFKMLRWEISVILFFVFIVAVRTEIPSKGKHTRVLDSLQHGSSNEDADMPRFAEPIANVTVSIGRDALLACVVENLKSYKVAWVRVDTQTILSIHHNLISQNNRISLTYNDHRSWYLHIKEVEESDRGWYMCQVNTDPMRSRKGYLQVVVPPMIVEGMTSNDLVVREGLNVTLVCKAKGYPEPYVMWRREDGEEMLIGGEHVNVVDGEILYITKVSRLHMAAYLCVASNGVPPSISKRVHLRVQFPPMLSIPNQLEGAYLGQDVVLECHTEAYPASINYWTTERGDMIISDTSRAGDKYETFTVVTGYTKFMKLKIRSVGPNDFGTYRCVAKNSLGETDGNIKLDEMPTPTTAIISETGMWNRSIDGKRRNRNKFDLNALPDYGVEEWRDGAGNGGLNGGKHIHSDGNDNNQTPGVRNPPGAFHNSAGGGLAQYNLLGRIIQRIKKQSFGMLKHLSTYFVGTQSTAAVKQAYTRGKRFADCNNEWQYEQNNLFTTEILNYTTTIATMVNLKQPLKISVLNGYDLFEAKNDDEQRLLLYNKSKNNRKWQQINKKLLLLQILKTINLNIQSFIMSWKFWTTVNTTVTITTNTNTNSNFNFNLNFDTNANPNTIIHGILSATSTTIISAILLPTQAIKITATIFICIIIFSIFVMSMLLHLIIDSNCRSENRRLCHNHNQDQSQSQSQNRSRNQSDNTEKVSGKNLSRCFIPKAYNIKITKATTYTISENRHSPQSRPPLKSTIATPTQFSVNAHTVTLNRESNFEITFLAKLQQQEKEYKKITTFKHNKQNNPKSITTSTSKSAKSAISTSRATGPETATTTATAKVLRITQILRKIRKHPSALAIFTIFSCFLHLTLIALR